MRINTQTEGEKAANDIKRDIALCEIQTKLNQLSVELNTLTEQLKIVLSNN